MKIFGKTLLLSAVAAALTVASLSPAAADDRWRNHGGWGNHGGYHDYHRGGWGRGNGWALGAAGLAGGLLLGSAIASEPTYYDEGYAPEYYAPPRRVYYAPEPAPVYRQAYTGGLTVWSPEWHRYCENRYRTFDGRSGTFIGNDGRPHFCVAS